MELIQKKRNLEKDQKEELLEIIYENSDAILMVNQNWMNDFRARNDISNYKYELRKPSNSSTILLDVFENSDKDSCHYLGALEFEYIRGYYFLKGNFFLGYSSNKTNKIICLE